jgi:hypothetical protein
MTNLDSVASLELYQRFSYDSHISEPLYIRNFQSTMLNTQTNTNGRGVRFLYSPTSRILSIHYFNLLPFSS